MDNHSEYYITCEFEYKNTWYIAYLCPFFELSDYEMELYNVSQYSYVVHLFSLTGFKTFELFPDTRLNWVTNALPLLIEENIIIILGSVLVNAFH